MKALVKNVAHGGNVTVNAIGGVMMREVNRAYQQGFCDGIEEAIELIKKHKKDGNAATREQVYEELTTLLEGLL
jgi:hypothetical protein